MEKFFGEFFRLIKQADPSTYGAFLQRAEEEFKRHDWREEIPSTVENILIVRLDVIGDMILTSALFAKSEQIFQTPE